MVPPTIQRIDKFDVLRRLGRGGMGTVYLARDPDIDRLVAIKLLHEGFDEDELRGRFLAEARSASALRHTNIVTIFQTGTFLSRPFIVMEHVAGETFADIVASGRSVPIRQKLALLDQLLAGLQYAHSKGIVHRDIKPSNLMVDGEGVVRILDFGIARFGDSGLTQTGAVLGTLNYMSPEQLSGKPVDPRSDIFSAGLVAYELLASKPAFPQAFPEVVTQIGFHNPPPLEESCPGIDARLVEIVGRCLAKPADERYADCGALRRDLDSVSQTVGVGETAAADAPTPAWTPVPSSSVPAADAGRETVRIDRPPTNPSVAGAPQAAPDLPATMVIPRGVAPSTGQTPAPVRSPNRRSRVGLLAVVGTAVVVVATAVGVWRVTRSGDQSNGAASDSPGAPAVPVPQPAVETPARVGAGGAADSLPPAGNRPAGQEKPADAVRPNVDAPRQAGRATTRAPQPAPVRVGGAVKAPKLLKRVSPGYPSMALSARLQGAVILEATIGVDGKVRNVRVIRSIPLLDTAAADAVRQWEYEPTLIKGVAVPVITSVAVEFKLTPPQPVRVGGAIKAPTQTKRVSPPYPPQAQAAGVQGVVVLEATIGVDGKVTDVRVLRSIPLLDQAAIDAVRQWEYTPTLLNDVAVPVLMSVTVNFTLTPAPAAPPPAK